MKDVLAAIAALGKNNEKTATELRAEMEARFQSFTPPPPPSKKDEPEDLDPDVEKALNNRTQHIQAQLQRMEDARDYEAFKVEIDKVKPDDDTLKLANDIFRAERQAGRMTSRLSILDVAMGRRAREGKLKLGGQPTDESEIDNSDAFVERPGRRASATADDNTYAPDVDLPMKPSLKQMKEYGKKHLDKYGPW